MANQETIHGGATGHCLAPFGERHEELDFDCIRCDRKVCWCSGSGCDIDALLEENKGLCCDCWWEWNKADDGSWSDLN